MQVVSGLSEATSGISESADMMDAQADAICIMLHTMLRVARDTRVFDTVAGKVPSLASIEIHSCSVCRPRYRPGDLSRRVFGGEQEREVYFVITFGGNRSRAALPITKATPWVLTNAACKVLLRVFPGQTSFEVQAYSVRALGDSSMGKGYSIDFESDIDHKKFSPGSGSESSDDDSDDEIEEERAQRGKHSASIELSAKLLEHPHVSCASDTEVEDGEESNEEGDETKVK